ncbi:MAG: hypothetical protein E4H17_01160 [Gemmatimonadales bacterium]|nr:MAG: hypothetical protein E4H17_01160 [Gemmatimonadales bacterium]
MEQKPTVARDGLCPEYEFDYSAAVRGKHYRRLLKEGANVIALDPDVAKAFRDSEAVNEALRSLLQMSAITRRLTARPRTRRAAG